MDKGGGSANVDNDEDEGRWVEVLYNVNNDLCIVYRAFLRAV